MNWIPIEERLPPYDEEVWLCDVECVDHTQVQIAAGNRCHTDKEGEHYLASNGADFTNVTHWMPKPPLPEAP